MVRTFIVLLLLAVFFLSGTLYGMNQSSNTEGNIYAKDNEEVVAVTDQTGAPPEKEIIIPHETNEDVMDMENKVHLTNNTASFLETSVQGFFEIVVGILYQIADVFF